MEQLNYNIDINKEIYQSDFLYSLQREELKEILEVTTLVYQHLNICTSYVYENEDFLEVGLYLVNNSEKDLEIKLLPLSITYEGRIICDYELVVNKTIEGKKSISSEVKLLKSHLPQIADIDKISLSIENLNNINVFPYVDIEVNNIPKLNGYRNYRDIKKFLKNLSHLEESQFAVDIFKAGMVEDGLCIIVLLRNSSIKDISLNSIPVEVYTESDLLVYKGTYSVMDGILVQGNKGIFYTMTIPKNHLFTQKEFVGYKVKLA